MACIKKRHERTDARTDAHMDARSQSNMPFQRSWGHNNSIVFIWTVWKLLIDNQDRHKILYEFNVYKMAIKLVVNYMYDRHNIFDKLEIWPYQTINFRVTCIALSVSMASLWNLQIVNIRRVLNWVTSHCLLCSYLPLIAEKKKNIFEPRQANLCLRAFRHDTF